MTGPRDPREAAEREMMGDPNRVVITDKRRFDADGTPRAAAGPAGR